MSVKKEQLQHNDLADRLEETIETIKPYSNVILISVIAVVVVVGGLAWWINSRQTKTAERWEDFYIARNTVFLDANPRDLETHAEKYPGSVSAKWASLLSADVLLEEGSRVIFADRGDGEEALNEAVEIYTTVIDSSSGNDMLHEKALFGRAQAYESLFKFEEARKDYSAIIETSEEDSAIAKAAQRRLGLFDRRDLVAFAETFKNFDPTEINIDDPLPLGGSENAPLPAIPDISFPTSFEDLNSGESESNLAVPPTGDGTTGDSASGDDASAGSGDDNGSSVEPPPTGDTGTGDTGSGSGDDSNR